MFVYFYVLCYEMPNKKFPRMTSCIIHYRTSEWLKAMTLKPRVLMDVQSFMSSKRSASGPEKSKPQDTTKTDKTVDKNKTPETASTSANRPKGGWIPVGSTEATQPKGNAVPVGSTQPTEVTISRLPWIPNLEGSNSAVGIWHLCYGIFTLTETESDNQTKK